MNLSLAELDLIFQEEFHGKEDCQEKQENDETRTIHPSVLIVNTLINLLRR
jgi:hypothetical protein